MGDAIASCGATPAVTDAHAAPEDNTRRLYTKLQVALYVDDGDGARKIGSDATSMNQNNVTYWVSADAACTLGSSYTYYTKATLTYLYSPNPEFGVNTISKTSAKAKLPCSKASLS